MEVGGKIGGMVAAPGLLLFPIGMAVEASVDPGSGPSHVASQATMTAATLALSVGIALLLVVVARLTQADRRPFRWPLAWLTVFAALQAVTATLGLDGLHASLATPPVVAVGTLRVALGLQLIGAALATIGLAVVTAAARPAAGAVGHRARGTLSSAGRVGVVMTLVGLLVVPAGEVLVVLGTAIQGNVERGLLAAFITGMVSLAIALASLVATVPRLRARDRPRLRPPVAFFSLFALFGAASAAFQEREFRALPEWGVKVAYVMMATGYGLAMAGLLLAAGTGGSRRWSTVAGDPVDDGPRFGAPTPVVP